MKTDRRITTVVSPCVRAAGVERHIGSHSVRPTATGRMHCANGCTPQHSIRLLLRCRLGAFIQVQNTADLRAFIRVQGTGECLQYPWDCMCWDTDSPHTDAQTCIWKLQANMHMKDKQN